MKTLVTGGAGFIGSHLVEYLLELGDEVVVIDDLSTGSMRNLAAAGVSDRLTMVYGSILDATLVGSLVRGVDRVFHLAAAVGVRLIIEHPLTSLRTNIHGTENVLEACTSYTVPLLLVSTSEVYGKNTADSLNENSDRILGSPLMSRWTYAAAKGIDESFANAYWHEHGLQVTIVRLFNTVGPRQTGRYGMVVPNLVDQALRGEPLTVFGDGQQTRCFSYVGDIVPALVALEREPLSRGQAYNLGGAEEVAIVDLAERILRVTGSASEVRFIPYDKAYAAGFEDMRRRVPDNTKAHELIGFIPATNLESIIEAVSADLVPRLAYSDDLHRVPAAERVGSGEH